VPPRKKTTPTDDLLAQFNKLLGGKVLQKASDQRYKVSYMPTGLLPFDMALKGGIPRGRFVTFTGAYSTMKSYLGLCAIAAAQQRGEVAALIDTEHAFDPDWAQQLGVDLERLIIWPPLSTPDEDMEDVTGEEALDAAEVLIRHRVSLLVFDSVAASLPQQEQGKRLAKESVQPGRLAALMSLAMRKLTAGNSVTGVLWINQLREQIGVTFGNPEKATGGRALPYYSSMILNSRAAGYITQEHKQYQGEKWTTTKQRIGQTFALQLQKSKLSTPWQDIFFNFNFLTASVDMPTFLFSQGVTMGLIEKGGNSWQYAGLKVMGREKFLARIGQEPEVMAALEGEIRTAHGLIIPGHLAPGRTKAAVSNAASSRKLARKPIQVPAAGASSSTVRRMKKSSK
jgi:recombination protein RecA